MNLKNGFRKSFRAFLLFTFFGLIHNATKLCE